MNAAERINQIIIENNLNNISYEKMTYSRSTGMYALYLTCNESVDKKTKDKLRGIFVRELEAVRNRLKLIVRQPAGNLATDDAAFEEELKNYMIEAEPALLPFVKGCEVKREGQQIDLVFNREIAPDLFRATRLP